MENHLLIENKHRKLVKFKLNSVQDKYNKDKTGRDIILKARQQGFSSFILALFTLECLEVPNTRAVVISHEKEATQKMLDKVKMYVKRFYDGEFLVDIPTETENKNEIRFKENNSTFYIGTAGAKTFGRGDTIHLLHLSEYAFYEKPDDIVMGVMQAVPDDGTIIIETTANGYNHLRKLWYDSKAGSTEYKTHFFGWQDHDEYIINDSEPITDYTEDEKDIKKNFPNISDQRLQWRRKKLRSMHGDLKKFNQEYPMTDSEAFVSSGNNVFNTTALNQLLKETVKEPITTGNISVDGKFSTDGEGFMKVWCVPDRTKTYIIGADPAEGLADSDYSSAHIIDFETAETVAIWHGRVPADVFGEMLVGMGMYYQDALIGCEANNHGLATNIKMRDLGYGNIYTRTSFDKMSETTTQSLGWKTDMKSKPVMINELSTFIREQAIPIYDESTIIEMLSFQEYAKLNPNSNYKKMGASVGEHDDRVISLAIALQMRKFTTPVVKDLNVKTNYKEFLNAER